MASSIDTVSLREVTNENRDEVVGLRVRPTQQRLVGTVAGALADAEEIPEGKPWYRAVCAADEPVGFVMLSWDVKPEPPRIIGPWFLWKILIDERHQGRGYGREAVRRRRDRSFERCDRAPDELRSGTRRARSVLLPPRLHP